MPDIGDDPRWLDDSQQRAWRALVLGSQLLFDRLDDELRQHSDLSLTEYEILVRLSERDGGQMRMAQLADSLAHSRSRVTHTVKRMEKALLVERCVASDDGRGIVARLTDTGWLTMRNLAPFHVEGVRNHLVDLVDAQDLEALGRVLNTVADHLIAGRPFMEIRQD